MLDPSRPIMLKMRDVAGDLFAAVLDGTVAEVSQYRIDGPLSRHQPGHKVRLSITLEQVPVDAPPASE